jgi:hypothetical protein
MRAAIYFLTGSSFSRFSVFIERSACKLFRTLSIVWVVNSFESWMTPNTDLMVSSFLVTCSFNF